MLVGSSETDYARSSGPRRTCRRCWWPAGRRRCPRTTCTASARHPRHLPRKVLWWRFGEVVKHGDASWPLDVGRSAPPIVPSDLVVVAERQVRAVDTAGYPVHDPLPAPQDALARHPTTWTHLRR